MSAAVPPPPQAVVAGHIALDLYPEVERPVTLEPGRLVVVGPALVSTGGAVANAGIALHRLGVAVRLVARVGDDLFGSGVIGLLRRHGEHLAGDIAVCAGDRLPKPIVNAGTVLGTAGHYTVGTTDPALYRNILTVTLAPSTSPPVTTSSSLSSPNGSVTYGAQVTDSDSVSVPPPGTGTPTGRVDFFDGGAPIGGCQGVVLAGGTAGCATGPAAGTRHVTAVHSGDTNYSTSTGAFGEQVAPATLTVRVTSQSRLFGQPNPAPACTIAGFVNGDPRTVVPGAAACSTTAVATSPGGSSPVTCSLGTLSAANYTFSFVADTLAVTYTRVLSGIVIGPLRVGAGQAVELGSGAFLLGSASVSAGGSLDVERAIVSGPLTATGAATLRLCAAGVVGPLSASGDSGPVLIGDGTSACGPSALGGPLTLTGDTGGVVIEKAAMTGAASVTGGTGGVTVTGNGVLGSLTVTGNGGGATVTGNTVLGSLTVTGNSGTVVDRPNSVFGRSILQ